MTRVALLVALAAAGASASAPSPARPALVRFRGGASSVLAKVPPKGSLKPAKAPLTKAAGAPVAAGPPLAGIATVLGGLLLHMTLGTMYCWGSFIGYLPPSMRFFDGGEANGRQPDALLVIPLLIISQMVAMPFGAKLNMAVGPQRAMLIGSVLMNAGIFAASFADRLLPFILGYSVLFGLGVGLGYTAPMQAGWGWFPNSKGLVNGIVLLGFGFGALRPPEGAHRACAWRRKCRGRGPCRP
jgi:hypothetical protein